MKRLFFLFFTTLYLLNSYSQNDVDTIFYNKHITMIFPDDHIEYYHYDQNGNKIIDSFNNGKFSYNYPDTGER